MELSLLNQYGTTKTPTSLPNVLRELMARNGLSQTDLARSANLPQPTLNRLLSGQTTDPRLSTLTSLADYFGISLDQLLGRRPLGASSSLDQGALHTIPVLTWETAVAYCENGFSQGELGISLEKIAVDVKVSPGAFALRSKTSMSPRFPANALLIIDSAVQPSDGDVVLVQFPACTEATLRQLISDGPRQEWRGLQGEVAIAPRDAHTRVLGVLLQVRYEYN